MADVRILLISGSTRRGSGNTAALRTVQALAPGGITAEMYDGLTALPAFSPDEDEHPPGPAADLRARIAAAGALRSTGRLAWAFGTWWIPLLVVLGLWRHVRQHGPLSYEPTLWSVVFPLGMYSVATLSFGKAA